MKRAFLLTGFSNWGKSTHIQNIFGQSRFYSGGAYRIPGVNAQFAVESRSNDDIGEVEFVNSVVYKLNYPQSPSRDLLCAFCPTRDTWNNSYRILTGVPFSNYNELHLLLLRYKWDLHAELCIETIKAYYSAIQSVRCITIGGAPATQEQEIRRYLSSLYP